MNDVLVVLPYYSGRDKVQGNELLLAIMGWYKYCTFKYRLIICGSDCTESIDTETLKSLNAENIVIPRVPKPEGQYHQHIDVQNNWRVLYNMFKDEYSGFIWTADDNYPIHPFTLEDITTVHYLEDDFKGRKVEINPGRYWCHDQWKTRELLREQNLPHKNYTTHYPCWFEFDKLMNVLDALEMDKNSYVIENVYFNVYEHPKPVKADKIRVGIWNEIIYRGKFKWALGNPAIKFVVNSEKGWCKDMEKELLKLYTE